MIQSGIKPVAGQQLVVGALFGQAPPIHHQETVGGQHGAQAVGDDGAGAALHRVLQRTLDTQVAGGLVEDEGVVMGSR